MVRDGSGQQPGQTQQPGQAQQQPANHPSSDNNQPVLRSKAYDVVLPVTVRDKKGVLVTSLQQSDLTLTEEGRPQTIKSLTRESNVPIRVGLLVETSLGIGAGYSA